MRSLFDWLDHRTGYRGMLRAVLFEHIPGGARWRYVWGSTLTFAIVVQFITGIFLWMAYSPSAQTAWESVFYLQEHVPGGWIVRGIHHWTAQIMVPLLVLHLMQVVIDGAYKAPREVNYWFGIALMGVVLALSLTGYLLPWDQKGFWATKVATNLLASIPAIGPSLQRIVIGGPDYGHQTLTRFFALHAGVLPALLVALIVGHIYLFRRHGITPKRPLRLPDARFWPDQVLKDAVACLAVMAAVLTLVWLNRGAELTAPANPADNYSAARPDWYFMSLFELLKFQEYFPGKNLVWGSVIIPSAIVLFLLVMPLWSRWRVMHGFNLAGLWLGLAAFCWLTFLAMRHDARDPHFAAAVKQGARDAARAKQIAITHGIPPIGALELLRDDPLTQGPKIFAAKCSSCHSYDGHDGLGVPLQDKQTAAELKGWGSRDWLRSFMDPEKIATDRWWGGTAFVHPPPGKSKGKMVDYVLEDVAKFDAAQKQQLNDAIVALSAEAALPAQRDDDKHAATQIATGRVAMGETQLNCIDCHSFRGEGGGTGPDLTGWASREWTIGIIENPAHKRFYDRRNDRMPAYGEKHELTKRQIEMVADWLRGDWQ
ncbi:MAG: cytochrome b N-terminal domain-containing protein [Chthoniobacteraceae bacterium]